MVLAIVYHCVRYLVMFGVCGGEDGWEGKKRCIDKTELIPDQL